MSQSDFQKTSSSILRSVDVGEISAVIWRRMHASTRRVTQYSAVSYSLFLDTRIFNGLDGSRSKDLLSRRLRPPIANSSWIASVSGSWDHVFSVLSLLAAFRRCGDCVDRNMLGGAVPEGHWSQSSQWAGGSECWVKDLGLWLRTDGSLDFLLYI